MFTSPGDRAGRKRPQGLRYWFESFFNITPNGLVPVTTWTPKSTATDHDACIVPKGLGALLTRVPDNTLTGGNKRGTSAVDLQTSRDAATQVASGNNSVLIGGFKNTASGQYSVVLSGSSNVASGVAAIAGGAGAVASGDFSQALGNTVTSSGIFSRATGYDSSTRGLMGARSHATGRQSQAADIQEIQMFVRGLTTDATPLALTANNSVKSATNQLGVVQFSNLAVMGLVTAGTSTGDAKNWSFSAGIQRTGSGVASTVMVAACTPVVIANTAGAAAWTLAVTADTTNGALSVTFTGAFATSCRIGCTLTAVETYF